VNAEELASNVPAAGASYHWKVAPNAPLAVKVVVLPEQIVVVPVNVGAEGIGLTVTATAVLLLVQPEAVCCT